MQKESSKVGPFIRTAAVLGVLTSGFFIRENPNTFAQEDKQAQSFALDMDPDASPANTPASLGSREICAQIINNNLLDADEDGIDGVDFDITAQNIPESTKMIAFSFTLDYPPQNLIITEKNTNGLLGTAPDYSKFDASLSLPDSSGSYTVSVADLSTQGVSGSGFLTRIRAKATDNTIKGNFALILSGAAHIDRNNGVWPPKNLENSQIAINEECGASPVTTPPSVEIQTPDVPTEKPLEFPSTGGQPQKNVSRLGLLSIFSGALIIVSGLKIIRKNRS
ncbi:hypothetical protein HY382_02985 [Candidatus Curtissbacteria bacterium]|nr:hypothetical protein [Candidatus Curtissbacteria bacterium]